MATTFDLEGRRATTLHFEQRDVTTTGWPSFHGVLRDTLSKNCGSVVIDFRNVRYLFSGVLNALIEARVHVRTMGGALVLIVDSCELRDFFRTIGFDRMFDIVDDEEDAQSLVGTIGAV